MSQDVLESVSDDSEAPAASPGERTSPQRRHRRWAAGVLALTLRVLEAICTDDLADAIEQLPDHRRARDLAAQYAAMRGFNR